LAKQVRVIFGKQIVKNGEKLEKLNQQQQREHQLAGKVYIYKSTKIWIIPGRINTSAGDMGPIRLAILVFLTFVKGKSIFLKCQKMILGAGTKFISL
jgi:hypothetical protein